MSRLRDRLLQTGGAAGLGGLAAAAVVAAAAMPTTATAQCSVFDRHPCNPTFCGVFHRGPCMPEFDYPIGQDLRLTIESGPEDSAPAADANSAQQANVEPHAERRDADGERRLDSIRELFAALRACWVPPAASDARPGTQMSVRLSFKRSGEIMGTPRVTYVSPDTPNDVRDRYHDAITAALDRCTPMPFTNGMGGAVAGRPIAIRFVDNRHKP